MHFAFNRREYALSENKQRLYWSVLDKTILNKLRLNRHAGNGSVIYSNWGMLPIFDLNKAIEWKFTI